MILWFVVFVFLNFSAVACISNSACAMITKLFRDHDGACNCFAFSVNKSLFHLLKWHNLFRNSNTIIMGQHSSGPSNCNFHGCVLMVFCFASVAKRSYYYNWKLSIVLCMNIRRTLIVSHNMYVGQFIFFSLHKAIISKLWSGEFKDLVTGPSILTAHP